jgi:hypothetical protein
MMNVRLFRSAPFAYLMHLLLPGLAHALYREFLFGLFLFLVMQLGAALLVTSFLVDIPAAARWILLGLPALFYVFSFYDLSRTIKKNRDRLTRSQPLILGALALALIFQCLAPTAPGNFIWRNHPEVFVGENNDYSPLIVRGGFGWSNNLAYMVEIPLMNRPVVHALPQRFDLVRYRDPQGRHRTGLVVGLPQEQVECSDGMLSAGGVITMLPHFGNGALTGSWPLTMVDSYSILVGEVKLGVVVSVSQVSLFDVSGRIEQLSE